jgi:KaiC/GvpD/RAD55 family RecA-like ATPase/CheY-like chemotaxis protein
VLRSGVAPIDQRLGGLTSGKPHLLTGPPGSGKTAICLAFLGNALWEGKSAAILTEDEPPELLAHAVDLGLDLKRAAESGRFTMVCYKRDFVAKFDSTISPDRLVDELVRLIGPGAPDCLVVDSVVPFVHIGSAAGPGVTALVHVLDRLRSTALVTYPGDVRDYYDRRLDALVRRCAAMLHVSSYGDGVGRMDVIKSRARLRSDSPSFFGVRAGCGVVPLDENAPESDANAPFRRHVLVVPGQDGLPDDLLALLSGAFSVSVDEGATLTMETLAPDVGAVVVPARWDAIADAVTFLRQLRQFGNRTPVILVTRGDVRSSDRARAVEAGFDEVLADAADPAEFVARVAAALRRGRSLAIPAATPLDARRAETREPRAESREPTADSREPRAAVLDETSFRLAVETAASDERGLFSVLFVSPDEGELDSLSALVARTIRAGGGDLAGVVGDRVGVYLPGTRQAEARSFAKRLCDEWRRTGRRELRVRQLAYPTDREKLRADLRLPAPLLITVSTR